MKSSKARRFRRPTSDRAGRYVKAAGYAFGTPPLKPPGKPPEPRGTHADSAQVPSDKPWLFGSHPGRPQVTSLVEPIPLRLTCPECGELHIDEGEFATKPHHTHSCQKCGLTWRPAVVHTVGVRFLPGFKNEDKT